MTIKWEPVEDRKRPSRKQIAAMFLEQLGKCKNCGGRLEVKGNVPVNVIVEHCNPLWRTGTNDRENLALFCKPCAADKTAVEATQRAKTKRQRDAHIGAKQPSKRPMMGSKASGWKCKMGPNGKEWVKR